ncbi:MAG TPA: PAAR domain-containing protein [Solirubrobacteraceae bacterium]|nr:PAAR domain-containing protein [Solirubrobacteraceae bacterium]
MGAPAAKFGDKVVAVDTHIVVVPGPASSALPHPFSGTLSGSLSPDVQIMGQPAATVGSTAKNVPPHIPTPPGTSFTRPPTNQGTVAMGSTTVRINGKAAARAGDPVTTCNDPADLPVGKIVAVGTVMIG